MDLNVSGEEHLWSHRPAVFIFNHQSNADFIILAKRLRRYTAGGGKQEKGGEKGRDQSPNVVGTGTDRTGNRRACCRR